MKTAVKQFLKPALVSLASRYGPHTRSTKQPKLWLLMYHRILPDTDSRFQQEEPGMLVRPETLEMHIQELKCHFELLPLIEWNRAHQKGESLPDRACAITFDDGWADNYEYAFPILKAHAAPATLFAVAEKIGTDFQFWPNIVAVLLLSGAAPEMVKHPVFSSCLRGLHKLPDANQIAEIIRQLKQSSDTDIFNALREINWSSLSQFPVKPALMNWDELRAMSHSGLVDVGSHTCTHRRLIDALSESELEYEIVHSKNILQKQLDSKVELFCFPNGDYNQQALTLVKQNYALSVTTRRGINQLDNLSLHELTRIGLHDEVSCTRSLFRARLSGWL